MDHKPDHAIPPTAAGSDPGMTYIGLAEAIDQAGQAVVITDRDGVILYVNAAFTALTGYGPEEAIGQKPSVLKSGKQDPAYYHELWSTIIAGRVWHGDLINRRKDGLTYTEEMTIAPVLDADGKIIRYIAVKQDVTERRKNQQSDRFLSAITASSKDAITDTALDGTILGWNEGAEQLYGYAAAEVMGKSISIIIPPGRYDEMRSIIDSVRNEKRISHCDTVRLAKDGRLIDVSLTVSPVRDAAGTIVGTAGIATDIRAWRQAQRALEESAQRFQELFEKSLDCLFIYDFNGNTLDANPAAARMLGYEREEMRKLNFSQMLSLDQVERALAAVRGLEQTGIATDVGEYTLRRKDGRLVQIEITSTAIPYGDPARAVLGLARDITDRKLAEARLRESEERFRIMADSCPALMWICDVHGGIRFANRALCEFFGVTYEQVEGAGWKSLLHPDDAAQFLAAVTRAVVEHIPFRAEARMRRVDGAWRWIAANADPCWSATGEFTGHVGLGPDITEQKQAAEALRASEEKFRQFAENIREAFWMMNANGTEVLYVSPGFEPIWERPCADLYRNPALWLEAIEQDPSEPLHSMFGKPVQGEQIESEYKIRTPSGELKWIREKAFPVRDDAGQVVRVVGIAEDISEHKKTEVELAHQAHHDHLTGLPNRVLLSERLESTIGRAGRNGLMAAVIYVDLDGFKFVNDSLGHEAGDMLLQQATERLRAGIREPDTLARMGGDEFMLVINDVPDDQIALAIAERLRAALRKPFRIANHELYLTASLGIAMFPRDGGDVSTLRRNADAAMYQAKRRGKDRVLFYTSDMRRVFEERLELDAELRGALERKQLSLAYQPICAAHNVGLRSFEALLRWVHPVLGPIPPTRFIPVAEESGLIVPLGKWVLENACRDCCAWQYRGMDGVRVAVNVSALEFGLAEFADGVLKVLDETGLAGHLLDLELTETTIMPDIESSIRRMSRLRERGIRISIDDFGTGYSSLGYLPRLPVDVLKIDRSFVTGLGANGMALSLIEGMISLAHSIGKTVVVEGVETAAQLEALRRIGADEVQGFLLGKPVPLDGWNGLYGSPPSTEGFVLRPC